MDKLAKLIDEYNRGVLTERALIRQLETIAILDDYAQDTKQYLIRQRIVDMNIIEYSKTPEEIVIEKERQLEILEMIEDIREILGEKDFKILCLYIIDKWSMERIAKKFNVQKPAISKRLQRIYKKIKKYGNFYPIFRRIYEEGILHLSSSKKEADTPHHQIGYPFEFLQDVCIEGYWYTSRRGKKHFISRTVCRLPQYFQACFGDNNTVCPICNKCK